MSKSILMTGGTGFIGSHLLERLLNNNKKIVLIERSSSNEWRISKLLSDYDNSIDVVKVDLTDYQTIFENYDIEGIVHVATSYAEDFKESIASNIIFPMNLLHNAVNHSVKYFINTGTISEYSLEDVPVRNNSKIDPINYYATTKISFETMLKYYCMKYGIKGTTLKIFTPYGSQDDESKIIPYLIVNLIKREKILIKSTSRKIDPIYIDDITNAYLKTINIIKNSKTYNSFMIGSGNSYSIKYIYNKISEIIGNDTDITFLESDFQEAKADISNANSILNWKPEFKLEKGLKLTIDHYIEKYG